MGYRLLNIGTDRAFEELLRACAEQVQFALETSGTGTQGLKVIHELRPDIVILDVRIPDVPGLTWLRMLRQTDVGKELPVIVVCERKIDAEVAEAFEWGADDYVEKGSVPSELVARVKAVLRRRFEREERVGYSIALGPITLDPARHECRVRDKLLKLNPREYELLEILMRKAGRVLSRVYLLETVYGMSRNASTRAVDVGICRLRRALGPRAASWIETVERYGYRFKSA